MTRYLVHLSPADGATEFGTYTYNVSLRAVRHPDRVLAQRKRVALTRRDWDGLWEIDEGGRWGKGDGAVLKRVYESMLEEM